MSSNIDCGSTMDSFEISMKLSDSIYNEEDNQFKMEEDSIPDYVFPRESESNFNEIISSGNLYNNHNYYENNSYLEDVNMTCLNSNLNENSSSSSSNKISNRKKRSSLSSNASEGGTFKLRHELTSEDDIPEEVTLNGDYGITYRYIAEFSIYNNKLSRMMPLDCLPNKFESIYFMNEKGTLDSFVKVADFEVNDDLNDGGATEKPADEQSCEELTLVGTLIPYEYILNYEKEKTNVLKDNFRKLQRVRQKGGGSYKPKKMKEMPKSILKQGELKTFQITCRIHSWTIEFGGNLFDAPYIWVNSISQNRSSKTCYRLCWPANKYSKLFSSAKIKFEVISRLIKTLLSPNSNRIGYKTFLDQVTGKVVDKSPSKPVSKQQTNEQTSEQVPEMNSEPASESSSPSKKTNKDSSPAADQSTTAWGEPAFVVGLSEKEVLLMFPFIEFYLQTYSKKYNLSKTLGLQIITSMKNKLTKMILSEDSTLDESYISSNINSLLKNNELAEKIFNSNKLQTSSVAFTAAAANPKKRRSSVNKSEDLLKFTLVKFKEFTESFDTCQKILKISDFCHTFGDFLELPVHSSSLLSIQSFHSKSFTLEKSKCISLEILNQVYLEFNRVVGKLREEKASGLITQEGICSLIKIIQAFPQNTLFSTIKSLVNAISEKVFNSKKNNAEDSNQPGKTNPSVKRSYSSFRNESEHSDSELDSNSFENKLSFLDKLSVTKSSIDCVSWPVILDMVLERMNESSMNELSDYFDESTFDDYNNGEQLMVEETKMESDYITQNQNSPSQFKKQNNSCTLNNESFFEILNWSIDTLGGGKIGKEFIENVYNSQKKKSNIGRNDNLIGLDRFSNKYFLFDNINTQNTLYKSVIIVPSCMEGLNNKYISHSTPCSNPLCTLPAEGSLPYNLVSTPEVAEIQNFLRLNSTLETNSSKLAVRSAEPNYKFVSKKKEIESLINSLCEDHFCEFQLKLKLKSTFNGKEFEHETFNSAKYVQECIGNKKPVFVPFNMSLPRIDQEKQFFYFSVLNIIKEISAIYLKVTLPMVVCALNDNQTHFSILDKIFALSTQIFDQFIKGVDVTYYSSQEIFKQMTILIKQVCETTMGSLEIFGIQIDKQTSQKYSLWIRELEALGGINPSEGETRITLGDTISSSFNKKISVIAAYLKIWIQSIAPGDLITISTGGAATCGLSGLNQDSILTSSSGFIYSREEFMYIIGKCYEKQLENFEKQIPNQMDQLYYFKSGHFLVNLCWMNSILTKNRKANGAMLRLIEQFTEIPAHMANIEKIKVMNICYNVGNLANNNQPVELDSKKTQEENEAIVSPFILINCQVTPRKNSSCADEIVELVDNLKDSFENIQHLNIEQFSKKRTSNRIKNNNLSNSYRDAMIADSTFTIAESRETFIKKNLTYDQESQNETRYISLILPLSLSGQNNGLPVGRLSHLQRRSFEIFNFKPTTPFYIIKEDIFKSSIKEITEKSSFKWTYSKNYH
ncbi:Chloroquine resistance marker [Cryptosporidium sp. chipmunk genotype I]|uniref:Chloroquine resistance marker n=1 Tax=Cryptosporidium sp. chipmunk genotype I TaxID=1280935 RepID=UPI00351A6CF5|nr:Chloroquine resistance marker [Cryptosporidium sp. chipmunk genotype I]